VSIAVRNNIHLFCIVTVARVDKYLLDMSGESEGM